MAFYLTGYPRTIRTSAGTVVLYVDEGWGAAKLSEVEGAVHLALASHLPHNLAILYFIAFCWRDSGAPMIDLWTCMKNPVDDISGPLVEVQVMRDGKPTADRGVASGNTLVILGIEEQHRRACTNIDEYLALRPSIPSELDAHIL